MSASPAWPGPEDILRTQLDNGITLLVRENRAAPVVVLEGMLAVGAIDEPAERVGLSSLTATMLSRGSVDFDYDAFNETIESVGGSLSFSSESDALSVSITCLSEDFPALVTVMADALQRPTFPQEQFDLVQRRKLVHLQERDQDTSAVANLRFYEAVYGGHPLGWPVSGRADHVSATTRDDVANFYASRYTTAGGIFAISGDVDKGAAVDLLNTHLGGWAATAAPRRLAPVPALGTPSRAHVPMADKVQADIVLGVQSVARNHPDYYAIRVANTVLGVFGMMGRLGEVVREQQGLAYYVYSSQDAGRDSGVWMAAAGVSPAQIDQALGSIMDEIARMASATVGVDELADSMDYMVGVLPLALETNDGIASTLTSIEWYGLGLDFLSRYEGLIRAVTADDVRRVVHDYLRPEVMAVVTVGGQ